MAALPVSGPIPPILIALDFSAGAQADRLPKTSAADNTALANFTNFFKISSPFSKCNYFLPESKIVNKRKIRKSFLNPSRLFRGSAFFWFLHWFFQKDVFILS